MSYLVSLLRKPQVDLRWWSLFACLGLEAVAGSSYAFSVYSNQLKLTLGYSQSQIETAGSLGNIGLYLSVIAGLYFDRHGPTKTGLVGAALCALGYATLWSASAGKTPGSIGLTSLYCFLWSHGSAWLDTVAVSTTIKNFRANKATVLGLAKALFGLSASMLTLNYTSLFKPDVNTFLLFVTVLIPVVAVPAALATKLAPVAEAGEPLTKGENMKIAGGFGAVIVLMIYLCSLSLAQARGSLGALPILAYGLIPLLMVLAVVLMPCGGEREASRVADKVNAVRNALLRGDGSLDGAIAAVESREARTGLLVGHADEGEEQGEDSSTLDSSGASFVEGALSVDMMLIILTLFAGTGSGLVMINNLAQLTAALGADSDGADAYVVILSIANCLGRLSIGVLSDATAHRISRPAWLVFAVASMAGAQALASVSSLNMLFVAVPWTGFSYGMFWSLGPALISDRFGNANFASIYCLSSLSTGVASYTLSAQMASALYQAHVPAGSTTCTGQACFGTTFIVLASLCAAGAMCAGILTWRLRGLYGKDGTAIPYTAWAGTAMGQPSTAARWAAMWCGGLRKE